jgi:hypothetical protein
MNDVALPSTIKHPDAFLRSPSAGFDGVMDWGWFENGVIHVRGIRPTDVDGAVGVKHFILAVETKDSDVKVSNAQRLFLNDLIDLGVVTVIYVWGKRVPTMWQHEGWDHKSPIFTEAYGGGTMLDDMEAFARGWIDFNDARHPDAWRARMLEVWLKGSTASDRKRLLAFLSTAP